MVAKETLLSFDEQIAIVGAGPVGMALALELARYGGEVVLVDRRANLGGEGSRAINLAAHALRFLERLGVADALLAEGVSLTSARTYYGRRELFARVIPPPPPGLLPPFINVSQSRTEEVLLEEVTAASRVRMLPRTEVTGVDQDAEGVTVEAVRDGVVDRLRCAYLVGCDGASSTVRARTGITFPGRTFEDRFLIADIRARLPFANERRFFFSPPSNPGRQILIHPQPDSVWRIDWQVRTDIEPDRQLESRAMDQRIRALLDDVEYELVWLSAYRFHQRLATRFRSGRVFLAGDAAHVMSPFGGRGLNSGLEDAANLGWKLGHVMSGEAPERLLDTYDGERRAAAVENLRVTGATMRFMVPHTARRRVARDLLLRGSVHVRALRRRVDSGRLAEPARYPAAPVDAAVGATVSAGALPEPGEYALDVPCEVPGLPTLGLQQLRRHRPAILVVPASRAHPPTAGDLAGMPHGIAVLYVGGNGRTAVESLRDPSGVLRRTYGIAGRGVAYLLRPDGYIAGRVVARDAAELWPAVRSLATSAIAQLVASAGSDPVAYHDRA